MSGPGATGDPGDLGRRTAERRRELGLSQEEVAARAAMAPSYLRYLEEEPGGQVTTGTLMRLAAALDTSAEALSGGGRQRPTGGGMPAAHPVLEPMTRADCDTLLEPGGVGRLVFVSERGPVAVPVNFRILDRDIVFRTRAESSLALGAEGQSVGFEVDHIDEALSEGWSVLVTGRLNPVIPAEAAHVDRLGVRPWPGGERDLYLRLVPEEVSGRRIRASS